MKSNVQVTMRIATRMSVRLGLRPMMTVRTQEFRSCWIDGFCIRGAARKPPRRYESLGTDGVSRKRRVRGGVEVGEVSSPNSEPEEQEATEETEGEHIAIRCLEFVIPSMPNG